MASENDHEPSCNESKNNSSDELAHLNDWPYISFHLQSTLDHNLIERNGEVILSRALNLGRVVAFVSSGVSMSYGRLSWKSLVQSLADETRTTGDASGQGRAQRTLKELDISGRSLDGDLQSGRYPAAFQFCEQVQVAEQGERGRKEFRQAVKRLLYNDAGHAKILLDSLLEDNVKIFSHRKKRYCFIEKRYNYKIKKFCKLAGEKEISLSSIYDPPNVDASPWRHLLAAETLNNQIGLDLNEDFRTSLFDPSCARGLADELREAAKSQEGDQPLGKLPLHRFLVPAIARLMAPNPDVIAGVKSKARPVETLLRSVGTAPPSDGKRTSAVPPERDPLAILADRLRIGRFITTNFDLDIERLIRDRGFAPDGEGARTPPTTTNETISPLGATAADTVFKTRRAADLIDFAINDTTNIFTLMHLHGRATEDDDLVVTERDYLELYLPRGPEGEVVNDALEIGFGSNPLLFVGNGMGEDDILRPLRQFMSERTSGSDRQAIALLPALGSRAREIEETIAIYSRYGAHAIHFGYADLDGTGTETRRVRWLALTLELISDLREIFLSFDKCVGQLAHLILLTPALKIKHLSENKINAIGPEFSISEKELKNIKKATLEFNHQAEALSRRFRDLREALAPGEHNQPKWRQIIKFSSGKAQEFWGLLKIEGIELTEKRTEGHSPRSILYPRLEIELIKASLTAAVVLSDKLKGKKVREPYEFLHRLSKIAPESQLGSIEVKTAIRVWRRVALAYIAALDGLPDALISLSLCAKLHSLHDGWMAWKEKWYALPTPRLTGGPREEIAVGSTEMLLYGRHPLALRTGDEAPLHNGGDRFFAGEPSQMFNSFLGALKHASEQRSSALNRPAHEQWDGSHLQARRRAGRRIFLLLAERGAGKGEFFESLRVREKIDQFLDASWRETERPPYAAVVAFNLRFSTEISSAFDRLANILVHSAQAVFPDPDPEPGSVAIWKIIHEAGRDLDRNRIGKLTRLLELYSHYHEHAAARLIVAVNAVEVLFNQDGLPKTGQVARLIEAVLARGTDRMPVDLLLVCGDGGVPFMFRKKAAALQSADPGQVFCRTHPIALEHIVRPGIGEEGRRWLAEFLKRLDIHDASGWDTSATRRWRPTPDGPSAFVHVLHEWRASLLVGTSFPAVALALAARPGALSTLSHPLSNGPFPPTDSKWLSTVSRAIIYMCLKKEFGVKPIQNIAPWTYILIAKLIRSNKSIDTNIVLQNITDKKAKFESESMLEDQSIDALDADFKFLFQISGENRFVLTIACAAADEAARMTEAYIEPGCIVRWFQDASRHLLGAPLPARSEQMIGYVLQFYAVRHDAGMPLPEECEIDRKLEERMQRKAGAKPKEGGGPEYAAGAIERLCKELAGPEGWRLQQTILWHLGVCSNSLTADVLAVAPKISKLCDVIAKRAGFSHDSKNKAMSDDAKKERAGWRLALVHAALDLLVHRCLVFRLQEGPTDSEDAHPPSQSRMGEKARRPSTSAANTGQPAQGGTTRVPTWRFTLHRLMQRSIYRLLHAPSVEFTAVDQYTLSLYGTLPNDLPKPRAEAVRDLDSLLSAWTGFPKDAAAINEGTPYLEATVDAQGDEAEAKQRFKARMLRAAFGVVRSVYSVGVVSRFDDFGDWNGPSCGYFEEHRLQIRWLLKQAVDLTDGGETKPRVYSGADFEEDMSHAPFFAEEIVWLYNECGLLSLIEGRLNDAKALFERGLAAAQRIEPSTEYGPLWARLTLNKSIVDMERGRVSAARHQLGIVAARPHEHPVIGAVADGYLGVCAHINGDFESAKAKYLHTIEHLRASGHSRGVAIFSRHLADLYRAWSPDFLQDAYHAAGQAIAHAEKGGHEDIRQIARLAKVRLDIQKFSTNIRAGNVQAELDSLERYAEVMGLPRLLCEVLYARASFLLMIGETRHAANLARRCLQQATIHDLKLRQVSTIGLLANIYEKRGLHTASKPLFERAQAFATLCNYRNARLATTGH